MHFWSYRFLTVRVTYNVAFDRDVQNRIGLFRDVDQVISDATCAFRYVILLQAGLRMKWLRKHTLSRLIAPQHGDNSCHYTSYSGSG